MIEIDNFPGYFITKEGKVFSKGHKYNDLHEMTLKQDKDGYLEVGIYKDGKRYFKRVHRLVAQSFIPNPENYPQVNHKDGNKNNNDVSNLEWCTCSHNLKHSFKELNRKPSITTNKIVILTNLNTGENIKFNSIKECANYVNMSFEHVGRILNGQYDIKKSRKLKGYNIKYGV